MSDSEPNANFIYNFLSYTEETEIPDMFALWSAIGAVSCTLGRRVVLEMGHLTIFPNLYIILVGPAAVKKSTSILLAMKFVRQLDPPPNLIADKITTEALIGAMKQSQTTKTEDGKLRTTEECVGFVAPDELVNFLNKGVYDAGMGSLLTKLWDADQGFEYETKGRGKEVLKNTALGILGGSTIEFLKDAVPEHAIGSGLTSRMIFVYVEAPPRRVAIPRTTPRKLLLRESLQKSIARIATYSGNFTMDTDAQELYTKEYEVDWQHSKLYTDKSTGMYAGRRFIHLLKVAMCLSAARTDKLVISIEDYKAARRLLEFIEGSLPVMMALVTSSVHGTNVAKILTFIRRFKEVGCPRHVLVGAFIHQIDQRELAAALDSLREGGKVKSIITSGNEVRYVGT